MPKTLGPKFPIVITSYEVAMIDAKKVLRHYSWKYLVVDEVFIILCDYLIVCVRCFKCSTLLKLYRIDVPASFLF